MNDLIKRVNRRAYFLQYGIHMTPREAIKADLRADDYKRQFPGQTLAQARRYAVDLILSERREAA